MHIWGGKKLEKKYWNILPTSMYSMETMLNYTSTDYSISFELWLSIQTKTKFISSFEENCVEIWNEIRKKRKISTINKYLPVIEIIMLHFKGKSNTWNYQNIYVLTGRIRKSVNIVNRHVYLLNDIVIFDWHEYQFDWQKYLIDWQRMCF